ncbi:hypothetical protein M9H77_29152 [Catharanthus roseus]|uniref:Uncharacterized protein n=1 Tax=Catharanthus roseus TaxID=4058 RepID=A0ACC0AJL2_CATRO|nr:hypothetical protein M9H77_29152 [Catharanthus roseus]
MELDHQDPNNPISDLNYAHGLHFQEVLMASSVITPFLPQNNPSSSLTFCEICLERKENDEIFTLQTCKHFFCNNCIIKHVEFKVMENFHIIKCPVLDCKSFLEFDSCSLIIPKDILSKWDEILCRSSIPDSQKFYCPYKNCSAMLIKDHTYNGGIIITEAECPECKRLFCAECEVPWHEGVECDEFKKLNECEREKEDLMLRELAKGKKWNRCPRCKFYVEKASGCLHMTCRTKKVLRMEE